MKKIWKDTLMPKGRYELKRMMAVQGFNLGMLYIFMPAIKKDFEVHEFVVMTLFAFVAACLGIAVHEQLKTRSSKSEENQHLPE
jgi:hypothetical protein